MADSNIKQEKILRKAREERDKRRGELHWEFMVLVYAELVCALNEQGIEWLKHTSKGREPYSETLVIATDRDAWESFCTESLEVFYEFVYSSVRDLVPAAFDSLRSKGISAEHFSPFLAAEPEVEE